MDILPMLNGWQRVSVKQQFVDNQMLTIAQGTQIYNYAGNGWLYYVDIITDDPKMTLWVSIDNNIYKMDAYHLSVVNGTYGYFRLYAYGMDYNISGNSYVIYEFGYDNPLGTPFTTSIVISVTPSTTTSHIFSYSVEFIAITNASLFQQTFQNMYSVSTSTSATPSPTVTSNLPLTQDLCV
jgi:hypothetical protein